MAIQIKFTCNICGTTFDTSDPKVKIPLGWGVVTPTLRVKMPKFPDKEKERKEYWEFDRIKDNLKKKLQERAYHVCHKCLQVKQEAILLTEDGES